MARKKKQTLSQTVVSVGTTGLPAPLRGVLTNRLVSFAIILLMPLLFFFGIVSVEWVNGWPKLHFNQQRAEEVAKQAAEKLEDVSGKDSKTAELARNALSIIGNLENKSTQPTASGGSSNDLTTRLAQDVTHVAESWFKSNTTNSGFSLPSTTNNANSTQGSLTISGLLQPHNNN